MMTKKTIFLDDFFSILKYFLNLKKKPIHNGVSIKLMMVYLFDF